MDSKVIDQLLVLVFEVVHGLLHGLAIWKGNIINLLEHIRLHGRVIPIVVRGVIVKQLRYILQCLLQAFTHILRVVLHTNLHYDFVNFHNEVPCLLILARPQVLHYLVLQVHWIILWLRELRQNQNSQRFFQFLHLSIFHTLESLINQLFYASVPA